MNPERLSGLTPEEREAVNKVENKENTYSAYVVMRGHEYLRFGSYSKAVPVRNPLAATLYSRLTDAKRRLRDGAYIGRVEVPGSQFRIVIVTFALKGTSEVTW